MRPSRALVVSALAATTVFGSIGGVVSASGDDRDKNSLLAAAQFELFVLTMTDFIPTDVTCTPPPDRDLEGAMLCYALISERVSVAAIATMESPGVYTFTPINKIDPDELVPGAPAQPPTVPEAPPEPEEPAVQNAADQEILDVIDEVVADPDGLRNWIFDDNDAVQSVNDVTFHVPTSTVQLTITTDATDIGVRDALAFYITDVIAVLWQEDEPFRDPAATIRPRFEVTVDGAVYGSPFDVMVGVADYTISETEWIEIVTGGGARSSESSAESRSIDTVTRKPRRDGDPRPIA